MRDQATVREAHDGRAVETCNRRRTCVVILGMHRSGTSALARVVNFLGAAMPRHIMGPSLGNEAGHWEPDKLVAFHDHMLAELKSAWDDWTPLDLSQLSHDRRQEIKARIAAIIDDEYHDAPLFVVKDPRICRFAPLFLEALSDAGITPHCVLIFRNPLEVMQSLERRDGMKAGQAGLLWLRHVVDAEAASRGTPRSMLFYDDLLQDWRRAFRDVTFGTGRDQECIRPKLTEIAEKHIDLFLTSAHRHHTASETDFSDVPLLSSWIADVHGALRQLRQNPTSVEPLAAIDRVHREFDRAVPVITRIHDDLHEQLGTVQRSEAEIQSLRQELSTYSQEVATLRSELTALQRDSATRHEQHCIALEQMQTDRDVARRQYDEIINSTSWRLAKPIRLVAKRIPVGVRQHLRRLVARMALISRAATNAKMPTTVEPG